MFEIAFDDRRKKKYNNDKMYLHIPCITLKHLSLHFVVSAFCNYMKVYNGVEGTASVFIRN